MAWYRTGTVSVTNGSTAVTGSGTNFIAGAQVGEGFAAPDGRLYEIVAIVSATSLTIGKAYLGSTQTGQSYEIVPTQSLVASLASQVSTLISDFQSVADLAGEGKFDYGTAASPGITFTLDQDTGFFHDTNNEIGVAAGGTKVAEFNSGGLTFASGKGVVGGLDVSGIATITGDLNLGDELNLTDTGNNFVDHYGTMRMRYYDGAAFYDTMSISPTATVFNDAGRDLDFRIESDTNTHAFFLQGSDGYVGIGTSTPEAPLTINPGGTSTTSIGGRNISYGVNTIVTSGRTGYLCRVLNSFTGDGDNAGFQWIYPFDTGGNANNKVFRSATGATLADKFWVNQAGGGYFAGNVGIGTSSPSEKLHISGTGETILVTPVDYSGNQDSAYLIASATNYSGTTNNWGTYGYQHRLKVNALGVPRATIDTSLGEAYSVNHQSVICPNGVTLGTAAGTYNAANTLDDYEEGTWTPQFTPSSGAFGSIGYSYSTGAYTKVGRLVTVTARIGLNSSAPTIGTATGIVNISGLPFAVASGQEHYTAMNFTFINNFGAGTAPSSAFVSQGSTVAQMMIRADSDNNEVAYTPANLVSSGGSSGFMISATYYTN